MSKSRFMEAEDESWLGREVVTRLFFIFVIAVAAGFLGEAYSAIFYGNDNDSFYQGFRSGFSVGLLTGLFESFYVASVRKSWIRRLAFLPSLIVRILVITFIVRLSLVGNEALTQYLRGQAYVFDGDVAGEIRDTVFSLFLIVFFVVQLQFTQVIGFTRFNNLLAGRYFKPVEEERIFLFVDLIDSSSAARELGDVRFHEYLSEFFHQLDRAIVRNGGEIVSYVGDAVIVTWPLHENAERNAACLRALTTMRQRVQSRSSYFEREFGRVPEFRAALHGGPVVVGECGDSRRQITFLGDVVNMTARIEEACKAEHQPFLISDALAKRIIPPMDISFEEHGMVHLKGANEPFKLHTVNFSNSWENLIAPFAK